MKKQARASNPTWKSWSGALVKVCKVIDEKTIKEMSLKHGAFSAAAHTDAPTPLLGMDFLSKLSGAKWKTLRQYPRMRASFILANMRSPPMMVEVGKCMLIKVPMILKLTADKYLPTVAACEEFLDAAIEWVEKNNISDSVKWKHLGNLDCRFVYHLCGVGDQSPDEKSFECPLDIMQA